MFNRFYKTPLLSDEKTKGLLTKIRQINPRIDGILTEKVFCINSARKLNSDELNKLRWLFAEKGEQEKISEKSFLGDNVIEVAPRLNFETSESTNAVSICQNCGLDSITRLEQGRRYQFFGKDLTDEDIQNILPLLHDKMIECWYQKELKSFFSRKKPEKTKLIEIIGKTPRQRMRILARANKKYGTGMDEADLRYYEHLIVNLRQKDLTDVEWQDLGNCNSEHSRHHTFGAKIIIDGQEMPFTLMQLIKGSLTNPENSVIAFHDNASAISGYPVDLLIPEKPGFPSRYQMANLLYHFVLTCETHNHPCLWAAYPGAATGGGGRRRDNKGVGRGGMVCAASTGFAGGNLNIPGYKLSWEDESFQYDPRVESPLSFFLKATSGAFNDGNEFGEAVINGFIRSFGMRIGDERWENIKPIMFTGGYGFIDDRHTKKGKPEKGLSTVKFGGKAYRIGKGGGAASSMGQGQNLVVLDFNSVQRADGEMSRKVYNVILTCIQMGDRNPIVIVHDQGAGGNGNVLKELVDPAGGIIYMRRIPCGDPTLSQSDIWVAEYQENMAILIKSDRLDEFGAICEREKVPWACVGEVTGDGRVTMIDEKDNSVPVDFKLKDIFGDYPQKTFVDYRRKLQLEPLKLPRESILDSIEKVFNHVGVASKEWLVHTVDRAVGGKIVQQQCVGPQQLPLSNYSLITASPFTHTGQANSIALRPTLGLVSPEAMVRMTMVDALLKLISVPISDRKRIKASINWMLAANLPGGIAWLYDAAAIVREFAPQVGIGADGGKDSLRMSAKVGNEVIRSLSTMVVSTYIDCPDYRLRLQPYIKYPGESRLAFVDLANGKTRLGGSIFAQTNEQVGNECPDVESIEMVNKVYDCFQELIREKLIVSLHKKGQGGLITTLSEMAFAGNCGIDVSLCHYEATIQEMLFNEELGFVFEYLPENVDKIIEKLQIAGVAECLYFIGDTVYGRNKSIVVNYNCQRVLNADMYKLREIWRETSFQMKQLKVVRSCVDKERGSLYYRPGLNFKATFDPNIHPIIRDNASNRPRVAVLREEGSNSFEEMRDALFAAGLEPSDVTMTDITSGKASLKHFRGLTPVGGFSFKDVLGSAKGWAAGIKYHPVIYKEFADFFQRLDTFSFSPCNGCQLIDLIFDLVFGKIEEKDQPTLRWNQSEMFESRFATVAIAESPAIMLRNMAGSKLGVHVDHGEGRFHFPNKEVLENILRRGLAPIRYVDDYGSMTMDYPFNPNGSEGAIAGLCSPDGRHLWMMPHPERTAFMHQWHYWPSEWKEFKNSPWLKMFQNARQWCEENK